RRNKPVDVVFGVQLRHAVESALIKLRERGREVVAAEDPLLAQGPVHVLDRAAGVSERDDELLEDWRLDRRRVNTGKLVDAERGVAGALHDALPQLPQPLRAGQREV